MKSTTLKDTRPTSIRLLTTYLNYLVRNTPCLKATDEQLAAVSGYMEGEHVACNLKLGYSTGEPDSFGILGVDLIEVKEEQVIVDLETTTPYRWVISVAWPTAMGPVSLMTNRQLLHAQILNLAALLTGFSQALGWCSVTTVLTTDDSPTYH